MSVFIDISLKSAAVQAMECLKFDVFEDEVAIAFFDMRGLPMEFKAQEAVQCYRQEGIKALRSLCVGYACIICDLRYQRMIFSSDSLGHNVFFYHAGASNIAISDVLGDIQFRMNLPIDQQSFDWYFICGFVPGNRTIYKDIYKLPPGEYILIEKGHVTSGAYNSLPEDIQVSENKLRLGLSKSLNATVERALTRSIGVMLSGGFDSSLLCWLIKCYQKEVKTYAIGSSEFNQETLEQSIRMARLLKTKHEIINVTITEYLAALPLTVRLMDDPIVDLDTPAIYPALRKIPSEMKFLFHGFGSDQLIGNDFHRLKDLADSMGNFPEFDRYSPRHCDDRAAGLFFIREKMPQEVRLHYRLSPGARGHLIFPFFEHSLVQIALHMPEKLKLNKKLLRSLVPALNKVLAPHRTKRRLGWVKGQVPEIVRDIARQVYGKSLIQSCLLQNLMGKSRLNSVMSSGKNEDILKLVIFNLWAQEAAAKKKEINHG